MKKSYFLQCVLTSILAFFVFCSDAFGQCTPIDVPIQTGPGGPPNLDLLCNGDCDGQAFATPSGGTSPYTYLWSPPPASGQGTQLALGFCAGLNYNLTVTDNNGCDTTVSFDITEPPPFTASVLTTDSAKCNGACDGGAEVLAEWGTNPSSSVYLWDDDSAQTSKIATGLCAGIYSVIIYPDPTLCDTSIMKATLNVTIFEPPPLTATTTGTPPCSTATDGSATVNPAGGTPSYAYLWDASTGQQTTPTATGLSSNTYTVIVTDANACADTFSVAVPAKITASFFATQDARCAGACDGSARAVASGGTPPFNYSWSPSPGGGTPDSATGLCANTTYTVTVIDFNGCPATESFTPIALTTLTNSITKTDVTCGENNGTATAEILGGASPFTFSWSDGQTTATATGLSSGTHNVTATDANGCTLDTSVTINERCEIIPPNTFTPNGDGINDTWEIANLDLYPDCEVKIYNRWGDIVFNQVGYDTESEWGEGSSTGTVSTLPAAVYYYVIDLKEDGSDLLSGSITIVR